MKTWKLVSGILSIVLCLFVMLQSCAVGTLETLAETEATGGGAGLLVSIMMLSGGIVSIVTRRGSRGGNIALIVLFGIASLSGFVGAANFPDLTIWAFWCAINVLLAIIALVKDI